MGGAELCQRFVYPLVCLDKSVDVGVFVARWIAFAVVVGGLSVVLYWALREPVQPPGMKSVPGGRLALNGQDFAVRPLWVDQTEVTVEAYGACVGAKKCPEAQSQRQRCNSAPEKRSHPVNCVSQPDAASYCAFVGKRLPTEAEWEWIARGREGRVFPWGDAPPSDQLCWNRLDGGTCPVGAHPRGATPEGVQDLGGNVWEWTSSTWSAEEQGVVFRGGGWRDAVPNHMRADNRLRFLPKGRSDVVGFRCVKDAE